jgi:glucuronoarabinoxylan endo-1,4-beta-xylanase
MAIDTTSTAQDLKIILPYTVKSGTHLLSTGNETSKLCQKTAIAIEEPTKTVSVEMPAHSLNTYIFMIDRSSTAIEDVKAMPAAGRAVYYDLQGRRLKEPHGLCIERLPDGTSAKIYVK